MDGGDRRVAVLACSAAGAPDGALAVEDLCNRPVAAAEALRASGARRVVLGLCEGRPSRELVAALRRGGAEPFGILGVTIAGRADAGRLLAAARARLALLPDGERGRNVVAKGLSRRALLSPAAAFETLPVAVLDSGRCNGCGLCTEACPAGAVHAGDVDASRCDACARCVAACPRGALHLSGASPTQLEAQLGELLPGTPGIAFAEPVPAGWALAETPSPTPGLRLQVVARGAEVELDGLSGRVVAALGRDAAPGSVIASEPQATVDAVLRLAPPTSTLVLEDDASPLGLLDLDADACTLCGACANACPACALALEDELALRHDSTHCVGCGRCSAVCPEHALTVSRGIDVVRLRRGSVELFRAAAETCGSCGAPLPPLPMRRRVRELLGADGDKLLDRCGRCARERTS